MPAVIKGRPRWQQALLLFAVGGIVGFFSLIGATKGMWGSDSSEFQGLYLIVFFASATAFISGIVLLFAVAVKAVFSSLHH
jgi:hypothetical protein